MNSCPNHRLPSLSLVSFLTLTYFITGYLLLLLFTFSLSGWRWASWRAGGDWVPRRQGIAPRVTPHFPLSNTHLHTVSTEQWTSRCLLIAPVLELSWTVTHALSHIHAFELVFVSIWRIYNCVLFIFVCFRVCRVCRDHQDLVENQDNRFVSFLK